MCAFSIPSGSIFFCIVWNGLCHNYTPYEGDETFLAPATEKTKHLWKYLDDNYLAVERMLRHR